MEASADPKEYPVARPLACYPFEGPANGYCNGFADDPQYTVARRAMQWLDATSQNRKNGLRRLFPFPLAV